MVEETKQPIYLISLGPPQTSAIGSILWYPDNCIYICAKGKHQIHKYDVATQTLSVFAGTGNPIKNVTEENSLVESSFLHPDDITTDKHGDLYVLEQSRLSRIDMKAQLVKFVTSIQITCIAVDDDGSFYFGDMYDNSIDRKGKNERVGLKTMFQKGRFWHPERIAFDIDGTLLIKTQHLERLRDKTLTNVHSNVSAFCVTKKGTIYVATSDDTIVKIQLLWALVKLLWTGHLKDDSSYCVLAGIPKDLIKEIIQHLKNMSVAN